MWRCGLSSAVCGPTAQSIQQNTIACHMAYKFEKLRVWQRSLDYVDALYEIAD
jgi:hypothetical protein